MSPKIDMFGIQIAPLSRKEAVKTIYDLFQSTEYEAHIVVTPNVDHIVKLNRDAKFHAAYTAASLVLVDGNPVVWAAKLLGKQVPETVPGSVLSVLLLEHSRIRNGFSIFLLGAAPGVAAKAGTLIKESYPDVVVAGSYSPPYGFEKDLAELETILNMVNKVKPDLLLVGLGAPKQELWAYSNKDKLKAKVVLCAGASIDFIAKEKKRAPIWMQKIALEWLYRIALEPKRLFGRYLKDALVFPYMIFREVFRNRS